MAAQIFNELGHVKIIWNMPSGRTNALNITRLSFLIVNNGTPIIQITVCGHIGRVVIGTITVSDGGTCVRTKKNCRTVGVLRGAEILFHPALRSDLHRTVRVSVYISHSRGFWTRQTIGGVCGGAENLVTVRSTGTIGGVCTYVVRCTACQTRKSRGETASACSAGYMAVRDGRSRGCALAKSLFPHSRLTRVRHITATENRSRQNCT